MSPTPRAAWLLGALALSALAVPPAVAALAAVALAVAAWVDARLASRSPEIARTTPEILFRGVPGRLRLEPARPPPGRLRLRQPALPDVALSPPEDDYRLDAELVIRRRGRHRLPPAACRSEGPLGLGCRYASLGDEAELLVYPDLRAAHRLVTAVRRSRFAQAGMRGRGPLGLGTDFESIRDYSPDDDVRQVNWLASARLQRPMSNQFRVEQDRDVVCVIDAGRLMEAPIGDRTRLDAAIDAAAAVALVADEVGDRSGAILFDAAVRRRGAPRRKGGRTVVRALFDQEPSRLDSDYELAFRAVGAAKRSLVLVFTDLLEETAARPLVDAVPVLSRRHAVAGASASDADLDALVTTPPRTPQDVYAAAVAVEVLEARRRVAGRLRGAGAEVLEAPAEALPAACVRAYLRAKSRARL
jgi:uncharacterized protein (DUF58 family)